MAIPKRRYTVNSLLGAVRTRRKFKNFLIRQVVFRGDKPAPWFRDKDNELIQYAQLHDIVLSTTVNPQMIESIGIPFDILNHLYVQEVGIKSSPAQFATEQHLEILKTVPGLYEYMSCQVNNFKPVV